MAAFCRGLVSGYARDFNSSVMSSGFNSEYAETKHEATHQNINTVRTIDTTAAAGSFIWQIIAKLNSWGMDYGGKHYAEF